MNPEMLNIVIPMAGRGSRFAQVGYENPKPLIEIKGLPMIQYVIGNLRPRSAHRFIFIVLSEHLDRFNVEEILVRLAPGCVVVPTRGVTEGAACTVLLAKEYIDTAQPLMIANSDQWVETSIDDYLAHANEDGLDGMIMTMFADDPKWSYVGFGADNRIDRVVEKEVISNEATVGIYNFRSGKDFVRAAESMINKDIRVNGEFYVAPVYNELLAGGANIGFHNVGPNMHGLGTPEDLTEFLASSACDVAYIQANSLERALG